MLQEPTFLPLPLGQAKMELGDRYEVELLLGMNIEVL